MNKITIIIPTVQYTKYLDLAIHSALYAKFIEADIIVNIGSDDTGYKQSKYWDSLNISWRYASKDLRDSTTNMVMTYDNLNDAIDNCVMNWIYILCDDDIMNVDFMKNHELSKMDKQNIYITNIETIDSAGIIQNTEKMFDPLLTNETLMNLFLSFRMHNHLGLFVFNKYLYNLVGKFSTNYGYPNGYYGDTIFNGKLIANCNRVWISVVYDYKRRVSNTQQSAKFYIGKEVNQYFMMIVNSFFEDDMFRRYAMRRFTTKKAMYQYMLYRRVITEYYKLLNSTYNKNYRLNIKMAYNVLVIWNVGILNRIKLIPRITKLVFITILKYIMPIRAKYYFKKMINK